MTLRNGLYIFRNHAGGRKKGYKMSKKSKKLISKKLKGKILDPEILKEKYIQRKKTYEKQKRWMGLIYLFKRKKITQEYLIEQFEIGEDIRQIYDQYLPKEEVKQSKQNLNELTFDEEITESIQNYK